jgi:hypothetical protein
MFVDREHLVPNLLESPADQRTFSYHLMFVDLEQLFPVLLEESLDVLLHEGLHKASSVLPAQKRVSKQISTRLFRLKTTK